MLLTLPPKETQEFKDAYDALEARMKQPGANAMVELGRARERTEVLKIPHLVETIEDVVEQGNSVVLLVQFRSSVRKAQELFPDAAVLHGGQTALERGQNEIEFQENKKHIIVGTAGAGGLAINLHDVLKERPRVSYITPGWKADELVQCLGRVHRAGGTKSLQHIVCAANTVEEKVYRKLLYKQQQITSLVDGDLL
jgi:CRISPR/Cas system-associated endonuclease/helicase Cas3